MRRMRSFHIKGVQTALLISVLVDELDQTLVIVCGSTIFGLQ
jgi:hypothetical protein